MRRSDEEEENESDEDLSSEEEPVPVEKRVRIIDPKAPDSEAVSPSNDRGARQVPQAEPSTSRGTADKARKGDRPRREPWSQEPGPSRVDKPEAEPDDRARRDDRPDQTWRQEPGPSKVKEPVLGDDSSSFESSEEEYDWTIIPVPVYVEKKVTIIDPKEEEIRKAVTIRIETEEEQHQASLQEEVSTSAESSQKEDQKKQYPVNYSGKHNLYSRYMDQNTTIMKDIRRSFLYEHNVTEEPEPSYTEMVPEKGYHHEDFTHGYQENRRYIIPPMTEHEIHRLGDNKFLEDVVGGNFDASFQDHIILSLAYMTVNYKRELKDMFINIAQNMQSFGNVYSARMLGRYHEYARMFKFSAGNEGMVASMRFTSHCSDIIKSYIQLAALVEEPENFANHVMDLAKRHVKLGLTLRDHQVHYRPFLEILGSSSEERMFVYSKTYFFLCLVSRAMLLAEEKIRLAEPEEEDQSKVPLRTVIKQTKHKQPLSRKQPIWD